MQGGTQNDRSKVTWGGLHVAGLCIGVDEYTHLQPLGNATKDAVAVDRVLKEVHNCYSAIVRNPTTRAGLLGSVEQYVQEDDLRKRPPVLLLCGPWDRTQAKGVSGASRYQGG